MEEGDCDFGEERLMEEGLEVGDGDEVGNNTVDDHQLFDKKPIRIRHFYFVKVLPLENTNTDAMIKKAEEMIEKMNRDQILIAQKLRERMLDRDQVISKLGRLEYYHDNGVTLKWQREKLNSLHLSLDKLTFANNAYRGKPVNSCLSAGEVDKQKLSFLMMHGCKNMSDERKLLREVNSCQRKDGGITIDELYAPIADLKRQIYGYYWGYRQTDIDVARRKAILKEIKPLEIANEKVIANAAVNGKLWNSLGSKQALQAEVLNNRSDELREKQLKARAKIRKVKKELELVEKNIDSLQKLLTDTNLKKDEAYSTILKLRKQYGEENACYYQYTSLMKKVKMLAEKKDIAAVQELCQEQVEKFMDEWKSCSNFRENYKKRIGPSLNRRSLGKEGRMITNQKPDVGEAPKLIKPDALSKARLKWLMKNAPDSSDLLI